MNEKKKYIVIGIIVVILAIILITIISKKGDEQILSVDENIVEDEKDPQEIKVTGYHLITYAQSANNNSLIKTISVTASNKDNVRFVIGSIDENNYVEERLSFELACEKGKNEFDLSNKRYFVKKGEYLFMDDFGQDILFEQENSKVKSLVQSEINKKEGSLIITESNYILPFEYTLEEAQEYHALVIGNDITTKDGGKGLNATSDELDYYDLTKTRLENEFKTVNISCINAKSWEISSSTKWRNQWIDKNLNLKDITGLDLVLLQLGDNFSLENIDNLEKDITKLIEIVQKYSPGAEIIWIGPWHTDEKIFLKLPAICEKLNIKYLEISDLYTDDYKSLVKQKQEPVVAEDGTVSYATTEVYYPNNEAMQTISNRIIEVLGFDF